MVRKELIDDLKSLKEEFEIVAKKEVPVSKKPFLKIKTYQYILKNGKIINRDTMLRRNNISNYHEGHAVVIVPVTKENKSILIVQSRPNTKLGVSIEVPAGYVDEGEEAIISAERELREETGYIPENIQELGHGWYQNQGCYGAFNHCFLATGCTCEFEQDLDESEDIRYYECFLEDLFDLVDEGIIEDANSIIAIERAKKLLKR